MSRTSVRVRLQTGDRVKIEGVEYVTVDGCVSLPDPALTDGYVCSENADKYVAILENANVRGRRRRCMIHPVFGILTAQDLRVPYTSKIAANHPCVLSIGDIIQIKSSTYIVRRGCEAVSENMARRSGFPINCIAIIENIDKPDEISHCVMDIVWRFLADGPIEKEQMERKSEEQMERKPELVPESTHPRPTDKDILQARTRVCQHRSSFENLMHCNQQKNYTWKQIYSQIESMPPDVKLIFEAYILFYTLP